MPECHCIDCSVAATRPADAPRRHALIGLISGLLLARIAPAMAGDDLLDPGKIGMPRTPTGNNVLPPSSSPSRTAHAGPAASGPRMSTGAARDMAQSVVASMDSLTRAAAAAADEATKLDKSARDIAGRLKQYEQDKADKLEEYRLGLFCSGCGKTKSEILAVGQTFPHAGQSIIRPTAEQIAAKERELQAPIDRTARELKEIRTRRLKVIGELNEAVLQIDAGQALWQTCISFEKNLIAQADKNGEATFDQARKKLETELTRVNMAGNKFSQTPEGQSEIKRIGVSKAQLEAGRQKERNVTTVAKSRAASAAEQEKDQLNGYFGRGRLSQFMSIVATIQFSSPTKDFNGLGGLYRMGSYSVAGHDEVLPNVAAFITAFRSTPGVDIADSTNTLPRQEPTVTQEIRTLLKDLLKCKPEEGEKCSPAPAKGGSGVRG